MNSNKSILPGAAGEAERAKGFYQSAVVEPDEQESPFSKTRRTKAKRYAKVVDFTTTTVTARHSLAGAIQPLPTINWSKLTGGRLA